MAGRNRRGALREINQNVTLTREEEPKRRCPAENGGGHRPMTRKYAAEIEAKKKAKVEWEEVPLLAVPMCCLESSTLTATREVEMEDIFLEDMDRDPLSNDLYLHYKSLEASTSVSPAYMLNQPDITPQMRAILIDWLIQVHHKFQLRQETLFLTVNLIDRFLALQSIPRNKLQLVGLVALLLAAKYEEVAVPAVEDLVFISDRAYSRADLLEMERLMLNKLHFNLSLPTPYVFLTRFLAAAEKSERLERLAFFFAELCLVEYGMLRYSASMVAAAAVYAARATAAGRRLEERWTTEYCEDELLMGCVEEMVGLHERAGSGKLTGVYRKYNCSEMGFVAGAEPGRYIFR